jgi:hypothetical protein
MAIASSGLIKYIAVGGTALLLVMVSATPAPADQREPIAAIGHGAFFDFNGNQIVPTAEFVAEAQAWYRKKLLASVSAQTRREFAAFERQTKRQLAGDVKLTGQNRLIVQQHMLDWLIERAPTVRADGRTLGKLNALKYQLTWKLPERNDLREIRSLEPFRPNQAIEFMLRPQNLQAPADATTNSGQLYLNECQAAGVPIPPPIGEMDPNGLLGWKSQGFIPQNEQFIVGTPAEVRTFQNGSGMCIALPRYSSGSLATVSLDGVICLSKTTSKVCIWDNQMSGVGFSFPANTKVPIGVPNLTINPAGQYQGGGYELFNGSGGVCTDCHAGENPYIIHPNSNLGGGVTMGSLGGPPQNLPMFAPNRYIPIVAAQWPQNQWSQAQALVPPACVVCHVKGSAGRFPHLSNELPDYCSTILPQAITKTMPPGNPGSQANTQAIANFKAWCNAAPDASSADTGDPHLTTTNGINYDFQAGGEFTSLRNTDSGFELQTRQTPVATSFVPGANPYTGLASCVSLNTAAAVRLGGRRLSYQPGPRSATGAPQMTVRVDGNPVTIPAGGLNLGNGNSVARIASGEGLDIRASDGTRLLISSNYWASEGYWYVNVDVLDTPARQGTMGHIMGSNFLPFAPDGSSFGPKPANLAARHNLLNKTFADAWRVTSANSLFDYAPGTSTATFTDRNWPPPPGGACRIAGSTRPPVRPMKREAAQRLCRGVQDKAQFDNCVFDVTALGDPGMAEAYKRMIRLRHSVAPPARY